MTEPPRRPPAAVLTELRREVRFHCPAATASGSCGSPYLTWHHFDPPWRVEKHHRPEGMIALCREHADKADNGSYTDDQLRRFKRSGALNETEVRGRFEWMRRDLVAILGSNVFVDTPVLLSFDGIPVIWFRRNENGEVMVNYRMPSVSPRTTIINNVWDVDQGDIDEVICPPGARTLEVRYTNGDIFKVEFYAAETAEDAIRRFPRVGPRHKLRGLSYPSTFVTITDVAQEGRIRFHEDRVFKPIQGHQIASSWFESCVVGIAVSGESPEALARDERQHRVWKEGRTPAVRQRLIEEWLDEFDAERAAAEIQQAVAVRRSRSRP
ncbi:hypothetical protein HF576_01790 [Microbacterium sp. CFH 90308]|uniref:HNH endonuclease n=1 Tax=Microbacterium salsuginis TaxID=2722803 RepID=A0ABX1K838_9MICO|nr:hypothetical protein [Microbacterium sp. CFH 90308]NLP82570.1 hypothetical protein [Microbacterium sp. CFH 90308]